MHFTNIIFLGVALSLDAVAVAATNGAKHHRMPFSKILTIAVMFGFFQFIMPIIGWWLGSSLQSLIESVDHWIAFSVLVFLGIKMVIESASPQEENKIDIKNFHVLLVQAFATSIDALLVGITLAFFDVNIITSSLIIGLTTTIMSLTAVYAGKIFGKTFGRKSEIVGGVILILLGIKILISHLL